MPWRGFLAYPAASAPAAAPPPKPRRLQQRLPHLFNVRPLRTGRLLRDGLGQASVEGPGEGERAETVMVSVRPWSQRVPTPASAA